MTNNASTSERLLLPAREAARALSISARTLWAMTAPRGPIPAVRVGTRVLYSVDSLKTWIGDQLAAFNGLLQTGKR